MYARIFDGTLTKSRSFEKSFTLAKNKRASHRPKLGVPFHEKYANAAFYQTIDSFQELHHFKIVLLHWQFDPDKDNITHSDIDGLLLPGGHYGRDFRLFGSEGTHDSERELLFKKEWVLHARKTGMPVLALCAGHIMVHYMFEEDKDIVELLSERKGTVTVNHDVMPLDGSLAHPIRITKGTHLHDMMCANRPQANDIVMMTNSWHDAALKKSADIFSVSAVAPDGVIEATEMRGHRNFLTLQWHPEYIRDKDPEEFQLTAQLLHNFWKSCIQFNSAQQVNKALHGFFKITPPNKKEIIDVDPGLRARL